MRALLRKTPIGLLIPFLAVLALAFFQIERNTLYHWGSNTQTTWTKTLGDYEVELDVAKKIKIEGNGEKNVSRLKISVPFTRIVAGCEFLYGAVIEEYPDGPYRDHLLRFNRVRSLIRFSYDYKNLRCESKDLSVVAEDPQRSITVQFVDVSLTASEMIEVPREEGIKLTLKGTTITDSKMLPITPSSPFRSKTKSVRVSHMSTKLSESDVQSYFGPAESFGELVETEIKKTITLCENEHVCKAIALAVSAIRDPELIKLLAKAEQVGCEVDVIVNGSARANYPGYSQSSPVDGPIWFWLKGNRFLGPYKGILQMHTKFAVFGDDLVISSNLNLTIESKLTSRSLSLVYRSKVAAEKFLAVHSMIRTAISYPLNIDMHDNFILLLNSKRPRRYVASALRIDTPIRSEEGVESSAYGILLHLLSQSDEMLKIFMSPITNSCFYYRKKLCLLDELMTKAKNQKLLLGLNSYFYTNPQQKIKGGPAWEALKLTDDATWDKRATTWLPLVRAYPEAIRLYMSRSGKSSIHHERFALLYPQTVISGSANLVWPDSTNVIEVLKMPHLFKEIAGEVDTFSEPYIVISGGKELEQWGEVKYSCLFRFESSPESEEMAKPFIFSRENIMAQVRKTDKSINYSNLQVVMPVLDLSTHKRFNGRFEEKDLGVTVESYSSYLCVKDFESTQSYVIRMPPNKFSDERPGTAQ